MLRKVLNSLYGINRNWSYFIVGGIVIVAIIFTSPQELRSQTPSPIVVSEQGAEPISIKQFSKLVATVENNWKSDYDNYFQRDFRTSSLSARRIARRLDEIKTAQGINPAVIWAIPQDDFLRLILITPQEQFVTRDIRGANRERLIQRTTELTAGIADSQSLDYLPPSRIIYRWLFQPLEPFLEAEQIDTLLLCTGPSLRSLPFAALHDGEQFMIEKYSLARIPAFNLINTDYGDRGAQQVLAMGASEFEDLPSLSGVESELNAIVPQLWSGEKKLNRQFTIANLIQAHRQGNFDIIHIASHARFNPGSPENSYIQFSDRRLNLEQLGDLELDSPSVDLLVLSACETAVGNEDAEYGFAGLAIQAGVQSAVASLWAVNDLGTVLLMSEFYQQLRSTPIKAEALRQAQLKMLQQRVFVEGNQVRGSDLELDLPSITTATKPLKFDHPYYWAGFTVIGNPY
ncbi:MAG: CHAT domain-containing protein [Cyanobacteria bacterium J06629_2]